MPSTYARTNFINLLKREFPEIYITPPYELKAGGERVSVKLSPNHKRWMMLDVRPDSLAIVMDHDYGDIQTEDLVPLRLQICPREKRSSIWITNDAVHITIFNMYPYNFDNPEFISFLNKHYKSHLRLLSRYKNNT